VSIVVDIQTISIAIGSAGVCLAAIYYMFQIRHQTRLREMELILRLDTKWTDSIEKCWQVIKKIEFKNFDDYEEKCPLEIAQIASFFETLGLLLRRGLVDIDIVFGLFNMEVYWQKSKLWVEGKRKRSSIPEESYVHFEHLYNEWMKRKQKLQS